MKKAWRLIGAATILTGLLTGGAGPALAQSFTTFSIGTTFGGGGHHHGGWGGGYGYGHGHHGHGWGPELSLGFSQTYVGSPYYSDYYAAPYPAYYPYRAYVPVQPAYAPMPAYYDQPRYQDSGYRQSSYAPPQPPADSCLQEREYQTTITIDGNALPAYGTACLQPDGSWRQGPAKLAQ